MSNFTDSYDPIAVVEFTHHILHLDSHFQQVDHTFNISYNSFYNDYTKSLIPIPAICAGLGLLAVIVLQISLCARLCCECCRFMPRQRNERNRRAAQTSLFSQKPARYQNYVYLFVVGFVITVLAVQSFIIGKSFLTSGVHSSKNTVNFVLDVFNDLVSYGDKMTSYGDQLSEDFTFAQNTGCTQASNLQQYMPEYYNYISEYESYVTPVPNQLDDVSSKLELWGVTYQNYTIWGLYFIILIGLVVYLLGFWRKSKIAMRIGIGMTELIIIFLFLLIGAEMFIVVGFLMFFLLRLHNLTSIFILLRRWDFQTFAWIQFHMSLLWYLQILETSLLTTLHAQVSIPYSPLFLKRRHLSENTKSLLRLSSFSQIVQGIRT